MNIIKNRKKFFIISSVLLLISVIALVLFGLRFSIEITGGSRISLEVSNANEEKIEEIVRENDIDTYSVSVDGNEVLIRTSPISIEEKNKILNGVSENFQSVEELLFETVGPVIGVETQRNAILAIIIASLAIAAYVAFAFRKVSKPVESWKYGAITVLVAIYDLIVVIGLFALLGRFFNVEIDVLFITAMLTVVGYAVNDRIVVFDRVRENLRRNLDQNFEELVNKSLMETLNRSLNTGITVLIVLFSLILFGGESIRWFLVALFAGVIVSSYSSIFIAAPLLVVWNEWSKSRKQRKK